MVAPDMRGYGDTDKPADVDDYDIVHLAGDMVGVLDALGEETAIMVGHDWGSIVAWNTVLLHPQRFSALIAMSVPYGGRARQSPMVGWKAAFGDNFYYILYHNEPGGVAEAEYDANPRGLLSRLYLSPSSPREAPVVTDPLRTAGGWIDRLGAARCTTAPPPTTAIIQSMRLKKAARVASAVNIKPWARDPLINRNNSASKHRGTTNNATRGMAKTLISGDSRGSCWFQKISGSVSATKTINWGLI